MTRDLTKWPRLLVHGNPVTREQANEILIRTNHWYLASNDKDFERQVYHELGVPLKTDDHGWVQPVYDELRRVEKELGVLDLSYLTNSHVLSSWIGGPHGWCDWDGSIGCSTWNIGKWPTVETVDAEWKLIASTFPYLTLRAQLVPDEGEDPYPACEWMVEQGQASLVEPMGRLRDPQEVALNPMAFMFMNSGRERGVTIPRLREALDQVRAKC